MPMNDVELQRICMALLGALLVGGCMILRDMIARKHEVDDRLIEIEHGLHEMRMQVQMLVPAFKELALKMCELREHFEQYQPMIRECQEKMEDLKLETPDRSTEAPVEFEVYRQDLWALAENQVTLEDHVNKWRGRKVRPRHDPPVKES
jgi:predicted  nucleic acid-binding Zn-ribbon protein